MSASMSMSCRRHSCTHTPRHTAVSPLLRTPSTANQRSNTLGGCRTALQTATHAVCERCSSRPPVQCCYCALVEPRPEQPAVAARPARAPRTGMLEVKNSLLRVLLLYRPLQYSTHGQLAAPTSSRRAVGLVNGWPSRRQQLSCALGDAFRRVLSACSACIQVLCIHVPTAVGIVRTCEVRRRKPTTTRPRLRPACFCMRASRNQYVPSDAVLGSPVPVPRAVQVFEFSAWYTTGQGES